MAGKQVSSETSIGGSSRKEKYSRRDSSETNSCSRSIDSAKDRPARVEDEALASNEMDSDPKNSNGASATCTDQICKSDEPNTTGKKSILQMKPKHHIVDESEAVSDISQSESEPSMNEEWLINESPHEQMHRTHSIRTIITNPSDHGSIQSLRENVDRVLMSSGRSRSDSRDCMQKTFSPAVAQMLYDQNYYRSADWLRFVPRKSSVDDMSSREESGSSVACSQSHHTPPDRFYRMFDNTRIRVGHSRQGRTVVRQGNGHMQGNVGDINMLMPTDTQVENFRFIPDLVVDETIDEEADVGVENAVVIDSNITIEQIRTDGAHLQPPTTEIYCDPNSESCQIALGNDDCIITQESEVHNETAPDSSNMQPFHSSLRKGAMVRPSDPQAYDHASFHHLPEHIREEHMHKASWDSKYETYACRVDQTQDDRAVEIPVFSMARPHMRAFHFAWISFFVAFLAWFSIAPLLSEIQVSLGLTKEQIWTSSICSVAGGLVARCIMGVLCDIYGARLMTAAILFICGFPTCFTGLVNTTAGLSILRLIIGIGGSAFVTCQYWTCTMFTREVAGTANALAAGWGNLGGGVTYIFTGTILFPFFKLIYRASGADDPANLAWRTSCIIPGFICTAFTFIVLRSSDDSPKGNYQKRKRLGLMRKESAASHLKAAALDYNTWILLIQYGCCFGVEITASNALALYFREEFDLSTAAAAALGSTFGMMNLFFRGLGGFMSDVSNAYTGMRGRLFWQHLTFFLEGAFIVVFSQARSLGGSVAALMAFSMFVQASEGSTFGIVPYLNPSLTGTVAGLIGAGGNAGGVVFSIIFRQTDYRGAFFYMGVATAAISLLSNFVWIKGYQGLFLPKRGGHQPSRMVNE